VRTALGWLTALAITLASVPAAHADDALARARQLEAALEYDQALAVIDAALARGGADPARTAELHVFAGRLAAGLDRAQVAEDHFARALAIQPATALPDGTSPKLTAPFAAAQARTPPLAVAVTIASGLVTIAAHDPLGLVAGIAVHVVDPAGQHRDVIDRAALRIAIPAGTTAVEVAALDRSGNRLWVGAPPPAPVVRAPLPPTPARYARPSTWLVITGVALTSGALAAWRFDVDQRAWDELRASGGEFTALESLEQRGRRWGLAANVSFAVALGAGVTTGFLWLRHRDEPRRAVLTLGPGAGLGVAGQF
jgi:tetratricopeptide (TPR) repeat protein